MGTSNAADPFLVVLRGIPFTVEAIPTASSSFATFQQEKAVWFALLAQLSREVSLEAGNSCRTGVINAAVTTFVVDLWYTSGQRPFARGR
jgi:hypothetical protein